jgi:hypothetical protein
MVLSFAKAAEIKGKSKYIELLDELDRVGAFWAHKCPLCGALLLHWSDLGKTEYQQGAGFLSEAVCFGLFSCVSSKLQADRAILLQSKVNTALIVHALIPTKLLLYEGAVCPPEMIELLLKYGADSNRVSGGQYPLATISYIGPWSLWEIYLQLRFKFRQHCVLTESRRERRLLRPISTSLVILISDNVT